MARLTRFNIIISLIHTICMVFTVNFIIQVVVNVIVGVIIVVTFILILQLGLWWRQFTGVFSNIWADMICSYSIKSHYIVAYSQYKKSGYNNIRLNKEAPVLFLRYSQLLLITSPIRNHFCFVLLSFELLAFLFLFKMISDICFQIWFRKLFVALSSNFNVIVIYQHIWSVKLLNY